MEPGAKLGATAREPMGEGSFGGSRPVESCYVVRLCLSTGNGSLDFYVGSSPMVRRPVLAMFAVMAIVLGGVVVSTPAGAVVDSATIVPSPNAGTSNDQLRSVSCVSASDCVAVGYTYTGSAYETLVMVWDGIEWSIVSSPNDSTVEDMLMSVSCVSASACVAVGYTVDGSAYETLVMMWDGGVWSIASSPNVGTSIDKLESVSCVSASDCVAVGSTFNGSAYETLVMVWDGIEWSIVTSPNASTLEDQLRSVSCVSASDCVAVGYTYTGNNIYETLVMAWDGTVWSIVSSPNVSTIFDSLASVSCVSASDCVAVGYTGAGNNVYETLVMSLTGSEPAPITTTTAPSDQVAPAYTG